MTYIWRPGEKTNFPFPAAFGAEVLRPYALSPAEEDPTRLREKLERELTRALEQRLAGSGEILSLRFTACVSGEQFMVTARAECLERIARDVPREIP